MAQQKYYLTVEPLADDCLVDIDCVETMSMSSSLSISSFSTRTTVDQVECGSPSNAEFFSRRLRTSQTAAKTAHQTQRFIAESDSSSHQAHDKQRLFCRTRENLNGECALNFRTHDKYELRSAGNKSHDNMILHGRSSTDNNYETPPSGSRRVMLLEPGFSPPPTPDSSNAAGSNSKAGHGWHDTMLEAIALLDGMQMVDMGKLQRRDDSSRDRRAGKFKFSPAPHH
jgi:hypothetical protein